ncbi:MAG: arsenate reductase ArsC [Candidatus Bathyarchaeota archaeon]
MNKIKALFLCIHNSARSQMAEGFLRQLYCDRYEAYSAGITPTRVNPYAIKAMAEVGIDISGQTPKSWRANGLDFGFDVVITNCSEAEKACPVFPFRKILHWEFPDPSEAKGTEEEILKAFRAVRDSIRDRIEMAVKNKEI